MRTVIAALAATLLLAAPAAAQTTDTTPTIAVGGNGTATLVPDIADFQAGVQRRAPTSAAARRAANARIASILQALKAHGVADADDPRARREAPRRAARRGRQRGRRLAGGARVRVRRPLPGPAARGARR